MEGTICVKDWEHAFLAWASVQVPIASWDATCSAPLKNQIRSVLHHWLHLTGDRDPEDLTAKWCMNVSSPKSQIDSLSTISSKQAISSIYKDQMCITGRHICTSRGTNWSLISCVCMSCDWILSCLIRCSSSYVGGKIQILGKQTYKATFPSRCYHKEDLCPWPNTVSMKPGGT